MLPQMPPQRVLVSVQTPLQQVFPFWQPRQVPDAALQVKHWVASHAAGKQVEPQTRLLGQHVPLRSVWPLGHWQVAEALPALPTHTWPPVQGPVALPQTHVPPEHRFVVVLAVQLAQLAPQRVLPVLATQAPLLRQVPAGQAATHVPLAQSGVLPEQQRRKSVPFWVPLQVTVFAGQLQTLLLQLLPSVPPQHTPLAPPQQAAVFVMPLHWPLLHAALASRSPNAPATPLATTLTAAFRARRREAPLAMPRTSWSNDASSIPALPS
jgi:hypothetical protein